MSGLTVVTGWSPAGWEEYGRRFAETFDEFWPREVNLVVYGEEKRELPNRSERLVEFRELDTIPGFTAFMQRHPIEDFPDHHGRQRRHSWKPREVEEGYSYRFDAVKFCRQGFIPHNAAKYSKTALLCWLDADVVTFKPVPAGAIEALLPPGKLLAYLGRGEKHSEIGFQLYRLKDEGGQPCGATWRMLRMFRDYYKFDSVFEFAEWHSAYCFDLARTCEMHAGAAHDLTPGGRGHVWFQSPLGQWLDHLKGDRKTRGQSRERR